MVQIVVVIVLAAADITSASGQTISPEVAKVNNKAIIIAHEQKHRSNSEYHRSVMYQT